MSTVISLRFTGTAECGDRVRVLAIDETSQDEVVYQRDGRIPKIDHLTSGPVASVSVVKIS